MAPVRAVVALCVATVVAAMCVTAVAAHDVTDAASPASVGRHHHHHPAWPAVSFWNWLESVVDPSPECEQDFRAFLSEPITGTHLSGGRQYLSTAFMMLCSDAASVAQKQQLPQFIADQKHHFNVTVDLLFGQSHKNNNTAGLGLWLNGALKLVESVQKAGGETPVFRFDVEYNPTAADAYRVLKMAAYVREAVDNASVDPKPKIAWALDIASMLPVSTSYAPCPAPGFDNRTTLIGDCFWQLVDHVDIMDFRSYAVQDPSTGGCDGAIRFAVPFLQAAAKLNKTVSVGFETNCGVASKTITEKISFCDKGVEALYSTISDVRTYLTNTSLALEHFPCAGQPATPLPPLPANMDFWTPAAAQQAFVVEDLYGWSLLAYNGTSIAPLRCAQPAYSSWAQCLTPEVERTSPTYGL